MDVGVAAHGLHGEAVVLEVSGSGKLTASGQAAELTAKVSGSGEVDAVKLPVEEAKVRVSGSGRIRLTATNKHFVRGDNRL